MGIMNCKINSKEDNARLANLLENMELDDLRIVENAMSEQYQNGVNRTGLLVGGALIIGSLFWNFVSSAIIKKKLNS